MLGNVSSGLLAVAALQAAGGPGGAAGGGPWEEARASVPALLQQRQVLRPRHRALAASAILF